MSNFNEQWLIENGYTKQLDGSWGKPKRVLQDIRPAPPPIAQPDPEHAQVEPPQRKAIYPGRVLINITSYCCGVQRDTDNIFVKHGLDCCRYAGLISSDCPGTVELVVKETRVSTKKEEGFEVLITPL